ncbi:hypothetical protein JY651_40605 [Pyxidicoccus parkwayensis]|uniref:Tetratricopeptide repeat protein n=1 Tax=Pyxidicoccus parkwayensis TaxID=2813578 RepID=A0ABX7NSP9_9BACT|nr:hypothetical protein [Pyxidicoccus parkwaysis]QSQ21426.1 hypothetical protein JY651_40605 [Pyxidicoccus parkwaysis]
MLRLIDNTQPNASAERVIQRIEAGSHFVWVSGSAGAGRTRIVEALTKEFPEAIVVEAPGFDHPDAALHSLLQAAVPLGAEKISAALDDKRSLRERAREVGQALKKSDRLLLLRLPESWALGPTGGEPERERFRERSLQLLRGLLKVPGLKVVLLTGGSTGPLAQLLDLGEVEPLQIRLGQAKLRKGALDDIQGWGPYAKAAARVREALQPRLSRNLNLTPLPLRLLVGLVALGDSPEAALEDATPGYGNTLSQERLLQRMAMRLNQPENAPLQRGVFRFAQARYPLPAQDALSLAEVPSQHAPLLTDCLAYGGDTLRMPESLRRHLLGPASRAVVDATVHDRLAKHYLALDGVTSPSELKATTVLPWLEKVHHLAHSGPAGATQWSAQELPARDFYWDRARALSIEQRDHVSAAALYKQCIDTFGEDDYSCHYYAYNLDRAGEQPENIEWGYRQAVKLASDNPWWNSRLVTFLISQARYRDAEQEWTDALERVDPDRVRIHEDERLALSFHRWVVRAWLDSGEVSRARKAFDEIPAEVVASDAWLRQLAWRLDDAEEAAALGESVYPAGLPVTERWRRPDAVSPVAPDGSKLQGWYPGRILEADEDQVTVVLAVPEPEPQKRRVVRTHLSTEEWQQYGGWGLPPEVTGFFILARYQSGEARLIAQNVPLPPWTPEALPVDPHLSKWART